MNYSQRFFNGINLASASFSLVWSHKRLVLYTMLPVVSTTVAQFIVNNFFAESWIQKLEAFFSPDILITELLAQPTMLHYLLALSINFVTIFLVTFFYAALTWHAMRLLHDHDTTFHATLTHCKNKLSTLFAWSIILSIATIIVQLPNMLGYSFRIMWTQPGPHNITLTIPLTLIVFTLSLFWSLFTFLVIPIIAVEHKDIWQAIKLSFRVVRLALIETIGGVFWILLIGLLIGVLLALPTFFTPTSTAGSNVIFPLLIAIPATLFGMFIAAALGVFRTNILYHFYERLMDELHQIEHPPF